MYQSLKIKSNLTKNEKIERLQKTNKMLDKIEEEQFNSDFFHISINKFGYTQSNIVGHYTYHFENFGFKCYTKWDGWKQSLGMSYKGMSGKHGIQMGLMEYHGISLRLVNILFFGEGFRYKEENRFGRFYHHEVLTLEQSIVRFYRIYLLLIMDIIPLDFDYNKK